MQALILMMFVVVTTFEYLAKGDAFGRFAVLPGPAAYVAEMLSGLALGYVVLAGVRTRFQFVRPAYWIVFGMLVITIALGAVVNEVAAGPVFAGIRTYLRAIPWFFVPAVFALTNRQLRTQLGALAVIALIQLPLAIEQTLKTTSRGFGFTGDFTSGTLTLSPTLTIFLVSGACILAALVARRFLSFGQFIVLFLLLLFPTTINETKVTLVILPVGCVVALLAAAKPGQRLKYALVASSLVAIFAGIFFPIYDHLIQQREYGMPIGEMLTDPARLERYLWQKTDVGTRGEVGRVDAVVVPLRIVTVDPVHAGFGYGIGNASDSALGPGFTGRHALIFGSFTATSFGRIVIELGLFGMALVACLLALILRDSLVVARRQRDLFGALAAGWAGVTVVFAAVIPYTQVIAMPSLSFLFWYLSGLVAAARMRNATVSPVTERRTIGARPSGSNEHQFGVRQSP